MSKSRPICPNCGERAERQKTQYGTRHVCVPCGLWSWGNHPLADQKTHEARKAAHVAFDKLWRHGHMSRSEAYRRLSNGLGVAPRDCHMKLMDAETAARVPAVVRGIFDSISVS